jgi:dTDP-4-dehydrorhamnose reductase
MKNILVLGSNGMAGHLITLYLYEQRYNVTAFTRKPFPYTRNIIGDALDTNNFKEILLEGDFDVIINCIGILNRAADDNKSNSVYLNSYLPHFIADTLCEARTKVIHMSTDCVFKGNTGPYFEDSLRDGLTFYDRSKALGELEDKKNLTFRNSIVGPDMNENGIGLFNWFMKQQDEVNGFIGAIWTGVTTLTLAKAMDVAIKENLTGLYNLVNNESINKYDLIGLFNKYFRDGKIRINLNNTLQLDKSLRSRRTDFSYVVPSYEQQIAEMKQWCDNHKEIYPHYYLLQ